MAVKTIKEYICDLCGETSSNEKDIKSSSVLVRFLTDQTEGRPCKPYFTLHKLDLCDMCLDKVAVVEGAGGQGLNNYRFRK